MGCKLFAKICLNVQPYGNGTALLATLHFSLSRSRHKFNSHDKYSRYSNGTLGMTLTSMLSTY